MNATYVKIKHCTSFWSWFYYDWNFHSHRDIRRRTHRIRGFRFVGFEFNFDYIDKGEQQ